MPDAPTIAAIATAPGRGGIGVIRLSGPDVPDLAVQLLGKLPSPRRAEYHEINAEDGALIDQCIVLYFPAPHSFTGEHILELQGHGGPVVLDILMERVLGFGARQARPGEFSERAFLNDKIDLAQAEAIADLIDSSTRQAAKAAVRSLQGVFSQQVHSLIDALIQLRVHVEAAIDFPEEEIDFLADGQIDAHLTTIERSFTTIFNQARQGCLLNEGMTIVIAGRPNAGKSSLLNALAGQESAIVTSIAGTTRDTIHEHIQIDGMPVHLIDTAGLHASEDLVEQEGIKRTWQEIEKADRILLIMDIETGFQSEEQTILRALPDQLKTTLIFNKVDLTDKQAGELTLGSTDGFAISAKTGEGIDTLRDHLKTEMNYTEESEGSFMARRRHLQALETANSHIKIARQHYEEKSGELLAEELRLVQQRLSDITGEFSSDDLLGEIFSNFCIGK